MSGLFLWQTSAQFHLFPGVVTAHLAAAPGCDGPGGEVADHYLRQRSRRVLRWAARCLRSFSFAVSPCALPSRGGATKVWLRAPFRPSSHSVPLAGVAPPATSAVSALLVSPSAVPSRCGAIKTWLRGLPPSSALTRHTPAPGHRRSALFQTSACFTLVAVRLRRRRSAVCLTPCQAGLARRSRVSRRELGHVRCRCLRCGGPRLPPSCIEAASVETPTSPPLLLCDRAAAATGCGQFPTGAGWLSTRRKNTPSGFACQEGWLRCPP